MIWSRSRGLMIWSRRQQGRLSFWLYSVCILSVLVMTVLLYPPYNLQASYKTKMSWTMHLRKKPGCGRPVLPSASPEALGQVPGGSGLGQRIMGLGQCDGRFHTGFQSYMVCDLPPGGRDQNNFSPFQALSRQRELVQDQSYPITELP